MISLVYKNNNDELDTLIMCDDTKISDVIRHLDGVKTYRILPYTSMDIVTSGKIADFNCAVLTFRGLCKNHEFSDKLSENEKKIIQDMLNAIDVVQNKVF